jgi:soluble lytic murein transglycosylase-like protein
MRAFATLALIVLAAMPGRALAAEGETIDQALCRMIERAAVSHRLPVDFFTRLIWQESSFRPGVSSRAGAQGVAQFMPGTARDRGLGDPFDPEQAIPKSAELLSELRARFGNLGLAAAAYNGGPARVEAGSRAAAGCRARRATMFRSSRAGRRMMGERAARRAATSAPTIRRRAAHRGRGIPARHGPPHDGGLSRGRSGSLRSRRGACRSRAISPSSSRSRHTRGRARACGDPGDARRW